MTELSARAIPGTRARWMRRFGVIDFLRRWPVIPVVVLVMLAGMAIFAPVIETQPPLKNNIRERLIPPFWSSEGSFDHVLGTDNIGRDMWSRLVHGARISLGVAAAALVTGTIVGTALGLSAGYFGGVFDEVIMRFVDIWFGLPFILVAMIIAILLTPSVNTMMGVLALLVWSSYVRYIRAEVLSIRERDYVSLARVAGASTFRVLVKHILPGVINTILVIATLRTGQLILAEATLSFLGAGIPPPTATWGNMVADGREYLRDAWWISTLPAFAIFLIVMSLNFLGDWMRDRFDPRLRQL